MIATARWPAGLREIKETLRKRMHAPIPSQGRWLKVVLTGYFAYQAVPTKETLNKLPHFATISRPNAQARPMTQLSFSDAEYTGKRK